AASNLSFLRELWSFTIFKISQWRWGTEEGVLKKWWWLLLIPLMIILAKRIRAGRKIRRVRAKSTSDTEQGPQEYSLFNRIEQRLKELGLERNPWEPPRSWIGRMRTTHSLKIFSDSLMPFLSLYYQKRFGKNGLTAVEQNRMEKKGEATLKELQGRQKEEF
ncbi:MAG: hypothetical protein D3909_16060, partial [Candidatus Electrothrix sp. ATG1]|nr:hypothetical protein [Candidatus Electrothrix sp. ATG1]